MSKATGERILVAKGSKPKNWLDAPKFKTVEVDGHSFVVEPGVTRITSGHPLVKARPDLFQPDTQAEAKPTRSPRKAAVK